MFLTIKYLFRLFISKSKRYYSARAAWILSIVLIIGNINAAYAVQVSDYPMETQVQSGASNIMFILDNSGSMDWEFMTTSTDGKFEGNIEYLFDDPGDNNYPTNDGNGTILSDSDRGKWKSQWSGFNKIYFDPNADYLPWPQTSTHQFTNADISTPRSNPVSGTDTFDLRSEFHLVTSFDGEVIVDNNDATGFSTTGDGWTESGATDEYDGSSYYTYDVGDTSTWTPDLPEAGTYHVYGWWCYWDTRDTNALYTINHAGGSDPIRVNQQQNGGQWVLLGTYSFNAGTSGYVTVARDNQSTQDSTSADAVKFVLDGAGAGTSVSIKRAHYYTYHDADDDGELDSGENVYLVNFVDSDSDNVLDAREYYRVLDMNGDDDIEAGELIAVTDSAEQDLFKPKVFDENGTFIRYKTDAEDLQNFSNWYQYYRRRELAVLSGFHL